MIEVRATSGPYTVHVGAGILGQLGERMRAAGLSGKAAVVTDGHVVERWASPVLASLRTAGFAAESIQVDPGERTKNLQTADRLYGELIQAGFTRSDTLVALGGGVVGDLGGFVAATYHRGMPLVQVPTTLLAQVDSSIGGKVAVDHPLGKNLIGAFYPPRLVVADVLTLGTLPLRERWCGLAEVVKAAFIRDVQFLAVLERELEAIAAGTASPSRVEAVVRRAVEIKAEIVSQDEQESGARMWLNFGHTFGHALETATGYGPLTHGEAVVQGMRVALEVSVELGRLQRAEAERAQALLARFPGPPSWPPVSATAVREALFRDKKVQAGKLRFVVLNRLGEADVEPSLGTEHIEAGLTRVVQPP